MFWMGFIVGAAATIIIEFIVLIAVGIKRSKK